jgi:hypothetical protein
MRATTDCTRYNKSTNHNFLLSSRWYRQRGTEIVLPNDTDGQLQTLFGGHDGLTMVSLMKRFIIAGDNDGIVVPTHNYCVVPTQAALHASGSVNTQFGNARLGRQDGMCNPNCGKVGVPVLSFDSVSSETPLLYLRSGLLFWFRNQLSTQFE